MRKIALLILLLPISVCSFSQEEINQQVIASEINEQVWKSFKASYETRDWQIFNDLHTDDIMRVSKWGIKLGAEYKESNVKSFQNKSRPKRTIDFSFEHRIYDHNIGYEVGFYRIINELADNDINTTYARFHVLLKKVDGQWKIAQDWDTDEISNRAISAEDFEMAEQLKY